MADDITLRQESTDTQMLDTAIDGFLEQPTESVVFDSVNEQQPFSRRVLDDKAGPAPTLGTVPNVPDAKYSDIVADDLTVEDAELKSANGESKSMSIDSRLIGQNSTAEDVNGTNHVTAIPGINPLEINGLMDEFLEDWDSGVGYLRILRRQNPGGPLSKPERDEIICGICDEITPKAQAVELGVCACEFCRQCMVSYLSVTVLNQRMFPIRCPDCEEDIDIWGCADFLDKLGAKGADKLRRLGVIHSMKSLHYCANPSCNVPFEYVRVEKPDCSDIVCPLCKVRTCVDCKMPWHEGKTCKQVGESEPLNTLKDQRDWKHCPKCNHLIERVEGCNHMVCDCGFDFCYDCGMSTIPHCSCAEDYAEENRQDD